MTLNLEDACSSCHTVLKPNGQHYPADIKLRGDRVQWAARSTPTIPSSPYLVEGLPLDLHCHGLGGLDFSSVSPHDLDAIEAEAAGAGIRCVPTVYLRADGIPRLEALLGAWHNGRNGGQYRHIVGFALEGPLLGTSGGTPSSGTWEPTDTQWHRLFDLGASGLAYMVIAPDAMDFDAIANARGRSRIEWVVAGLVEAGIRPAPGHFRRDNPEASAACVEAVLGWIEKRRGGAQAEGVLTDHLFNDMPRKIPYAWRTPEARARRAGELAALGEAWSWDRLEDVLGVVPATLLRAARDRRLSLCMNFDGEHVDLEICRRVVQLVGVQDLLGITDHVEIPRLASQELIGRPDSSLWYEAHGLVAAGSRDVSRQLRNVEDMGLPRVSGWRLFCHNPNRVLGVVDDDYVSVVVGAGEWRSVEVDRGRNETND